MFPVLTKSPKFHYFFLAYLMFKNQIAAKARELFTSNGCLPLAKVNHPSEVNCAVKKLHVCNGRSSKLTILLSSSFQLTIPSNFLQCNIFVYLVNCCKKKWIVHFRWAVHFGSNFYVVGTCTCIDITIHVPTCRISCKDSRMAINLRCVFSDLPFCIGFIWVFGYV